MTPLQKGLAVAVAALGGWLVFRPDDAYAAPNLPPPLTTHTPGGGRATGFEFPAVHLPRQWTSQQVCEFVTYMRGLLAGSGVTGRAAQLFIAHVGRETRFGQRVYDNAFGNVKEYGSGPWFRLSDGQQYRAYGSPRAGAEGAIKTIRDSSRYSGAWTKLMAGDRTWYSTLGLAGYYQYRMPDGSIVDTTPANVGASQADYERSLASVERCW